MVSLFALTETVLFFLVQTTSGDTCVAVSYTAVVLACLFMITSISKTKSYLLMQIGLICTVCADLFLVVIEPMEQLAAMIFFSGTQICYFLRLYFNQSSRLARRVHLIVRLAVSALAIVITALVLKDATDALSIVSMFYYANLILNVIVAFTQSKSSLLFPIGLLLFLCCDTVVGLRAMTDYIQIENSSELANSLFGSINWAWIFYVPSQTLIALSLTNFKLLRQNKNA